VLLTPCVQNLFVTITFLVEGRKKKIQVKSTSCNLELLEGKTSNKQSASSLVLPFHITLSLGNNYMQFFYFTVGPHDTMFFL